MLCPGCCTIDDIPDWPKRNAEDLKIIIGCHRCGFAFPVLPGEFKGLTLHALHNHRCAGPDDGNWEAVGEAIISRLAELHQDPEKFGAFLKAAWQQPRDDDEDYEASGDQTAPGTGAVTTASGRARSPR